MKDFNPKFDIENARRAQVSSKHKAPTRRVMI